MHYFITGGTGFIGRFLVPKLLDRGGTVYLLVRDSSMHKIADLRERWGARENRVIAVVGESWGSSPPGSRPMRGG